MKTITDKEELMGNSAAFLARIYALLRHAGLPMNCLSGPLGDIFTEYVETVSGCKTNGNS